MIKLLRVLPVCFLAFATTSCIAVPDADEGVTAYGAFLSARYAGVNRDAHAAANYYAEALSLLPGNVVLTDRAYVTAILAGDMDDAVALASASYEAGDPSRLAGLYLVTDQIHARRYGDALVTLENAADYGPFNAFLAQIWTQWAMMGSGAADEALAGAEAMSAPGFLAPFIPIHRAMLYDAANRVDEADSAYQASVFSSPFPRMATEL
jgi:tetratricopeptide (TPR) repeat protein